MGTLLTEEEQINNATAALTKDFERILINIRYKNLAVWEAGLTAFKLYTLDGDADGTPLVFGTKFPGEIEELERIGYNYSDDRFSIYPRRELPTH